jgi:dTDP-4-dehydrorhamnose reductase
MVLLSRSEAYGLYHATAEGSCSWFEFAREIFDVTKTSVKLTAANAGDFPVKVPRPTYSVLENSGLKSRGLNVFEPWQNGLRDYLGIPKECAHAYVAH